MRFAHLARCAAAIFLLAAALMVRFLVAVARLPLTEPSSSLRSSLVKVSSFSLIEAARLSCWAVHDRHLHTRAK